MPDDDLTADADYMSDETRADPPHSEAIARRRLARRQSRMQLFGAALIVYGLIGVVIFIVVAGTINKPLERARELSQSVEQQRAALISSLVQAQTTIDQMAQGVLRMDMSLADARAATDRSSGIALGIATSMYQLRDTMNIEIFGAQPLVGLAAGFDQAGVQLGLLSSDLVTISSALDANRTDVVITSANLSLLARSVGDLTESIRTGPGLEISEASLESFQLAIFAVAGWLLLFAIGCVVGGLYVIRLGRQGTEDA
jgi:hypothetical protein